MRTSLKSLAVALLVVAGCESEEGGSSAGATLAYVGCADGGGSIFTFKVEPNGELIQQGQPFQTGAAVSFAAFHPGKKYLYVNNRMIDKVNAFFIDSKTGALTFMNSVDVMGEPGSMRAGPVYVSVDGGGKFLLVANFQGSNVLVYRLKPDGSIGEMVSKQTSGTNAHLIKFAGDNKFALVPYLGSDLIAQYRFDPASGALTPNDPPALALDMGTGPRHLDLHPNGRWAYLVAEKAGTVTALSVDATKGTLTKNAAVTIVPDGFTDPMGPFGGHVEVAPSGKFAYATERRSGVLAALAIDQSTGAVTGIGAESTRGKTPRNFSITPDGNFIIVGNQDGRNLAVFSVNKETGALTFLRTKDDLCDLPFFVRTAAI